MMDDLVQWYGEQLDEDERIAQAATSGPWNRMGQRVLDSSPPSDRLGVGMAVGHAAASADFNETADHIAAWDPARVLLEVEADRRLLATYTDAQATVDAIAHPDMYDVGRAQGLKEAVRYRTLRFDSRPGYREEWRP
ncbi:DUF6221 family protein [Streptomyces sp. NPDC047070]|uniref:DUF6221 family protein n=1 Tax=Streptomyces sp. NPDC047070 TaxID=3154923 RepID=UPI003455513F